MGLFKRTDFQFLGDKHDYLRYGLDSIARYKLTELFLTEHALRELAQREETLYHRAIALQKAMAIKSDGGQLEETNKQLEEVQAQYPRKDPDGGKLGSTDKKVALTKAYSETILILDALDGTGVEDREDLMETIDRLVQKFVNGEHSEEDVDDILDEILNKSFKIVTRGVQFLDVWNEEVNGVVGLSKALIEMSNFASGHLEPRPMGF
ncbi:hypothetical protein N7449_009000 [Penicillium cf. viridicatum]|uniref:Uncharacterized protein n=1 Tax=Penicillium cf. viridicatum TaxID=2972119 RepID=A0A9W9J9Z3_9EURO|nr:hypothetical protein N7449_009000 [Penicillium cf. viridicatum]